MGNILHQCRMFCKWASGHQLIDFFISNLLKIISHINLLFGKRIIFDQVFIFAVWCQSVFCGNRQRTTKSRGVLDDHMYIFSWDWIGKDIRIFCETVRTVKSQKSIKFNTFKMRKCDRASAGRNANDRAVFFQPAECLQHFFRNTFLIHIN